MQPHHGVRGVLRARGAALGLTELLVEALDGDVDHFRRLWLAASRAGQVASPAPAPGRQDTWTPPRQLPADVAGFTGRTDQLAELDRVREQASTVGIAVVSGTAGVGKPHPEI